MQFRIVVAAVPGLMSGRALAATGLLTTLTVEAGPGRMARPASGANQAPFLTESITIGGA
jgi:hypothetical protein